MEYIKKNSEKKIIDVRKKKTYGSKPWLVSLSGIHSHRARVFTTPTESCVLIGQERIDQMILQRKSRKENQNHHMYLRDLKQLSIFQSLIIMGGISIPQSLLQVMQSELLIVWYFDTLIAYIE